MAAGGGYAAGRRRSHRGSSPAAYRPSIIATTAAATSPQVSPPSTHGMPDAPSAAIADRLRRPTVIMIPHQIRPADAADHQDPLHPADHRVAHVLQPGRRDRAGGGREGGRQRAAASMGRAWSMVGSRVRDGSAPGADAVSRPCRGGVDHPVDHVAWTMAWSTVGVAIAGWSACAAWLHASPARRRVRRRAGAPGGVAMSPAAVAALAAGVAVTASRCAGSARSPWSP